MVSSPKSSAKKKGSAAKSAAKLVSNRSAFRYGSKMAQMCADNVIARHVNGATNPALTTKWLNKMKLSILRKVSACSKVAFLSDAQQPSTLREEIEKEKEIVMEKKEKVVDAASELLSKAKLGKVMKNQNEKAYEDGAFDSRVKHISEKLTKVAHEVSTSTKNTSNRQESLQRTLNQVSGDWKSKAGAKKGAKSQGSGAGKSSVSTSNTGSGKNAPLNRLHQHLNK